MIMVASRIMNLGRYNAYCKPTSASVTRTIPAAATAAGVAVDEEEEPAVAVTLGHPILSKLERTNPAGRLGRRQFDQVHAQAIATGLFHNVFAASRLLKFSAVSLCNLALTDLIFSRIRRPDVFCYKVVIKARSLSGSPLDSLPLFRRLLRGVLLPNEYALCFLLDSCARGLALREGRQVHAHLQKHGLAAATFAGTSLVHMYGECGAAAGMHERTVVTWGAVINACVSNDEVEDGLNLFGEMRRLGVKPSTAALVSVLRACAERGDLLNGRLVHSYVVVNGVTINASLGTSLVDMYQKTGAIQTATKVFAIMPTKSVASWSCLIHGLAMNGHNVDALSMFERMQQEGGIQPSEVTFLGVLHACCHAGFVEYGINQFRQMREVYGFAPSIKHYGCMVDLFARAGMIKEATEVTGVMPMKPDIAIWVALLSGCRIHDYKVLEEILMAQIIKLTPPDTCGLLVSSDAMATEMPCDSTFAVTNTMEEEMVIRKMPGCSSIR